MTKEELFDKYRQRFSEQDLDGFVHELKSKEAADINNAGMDSQLEFMESCGGLDWMLELIDQESE